MNRIVKLFGLLTFALMLSGQAVAAAINPNTGDNSIVVPMLIVGGVALVAIVIFFLTGKKKK